MNVSRWKLRQWVFAAIMVVALMVVVIGGWTFYDAWQAEVLPWQPEPTRVVVTPFANLPTPPSTPAD